MSYQCWKSSKKLMTGFLTLIFLCSGTFSVLASTAITPTITPIVTPSTAPVETPAVAPSDTPVDPMVIMPSITPEVKPKLFSGGDGTKDSPFLLSSAADLISLSTAYGETPEIRSSHFLMTQSIDLGKTLWNPIGSQKMSFSGTFDGNGKRIILRSIADGSFLGFFGMVDNFAVIKNLTVKGVLSKTISSKKDVIVGLLAGWSEGTIENCSTDGILTLTINSQKECTIGGMVGFTRGSLRNISNNVSITLDKTGGGITVVGGITGSIRGNTKALISATNTGTIKITADGRSFVGGIIGECSSSPGLFSVMNKGSVSLQTTPSSDRERCSAAGIAGSIMQTYINRALNQGSVTITCGNAAPATTEIIASGIAGITENSSLKNVGNKGYIRANGKIILYATGIVGNVGRDIVIANAYNSGKIYGSSPNNNSELYVSGLLQGIATVSNSYNSGSIRLREGSLGETNGEAITNIRPGEGTKTFQYCYWTTETLPFPLLQKATASCSEFNPDSGNLSRKVIVKSTKYSSLTKALNAWVTSKKTGYVKWTNGATPVFKTSFGYVQVKIIKPIQ